MRATKEEALGDIKNADYEEDCCFRRNNKRRICVFCGKLILKGEDYYKHFEYPYLPDQKRWFACGKCFKKYRDLQNFINGIIGFGQ